MDLSALITGWQENRFRTVYLFAGPDTLQKEEALEALKAHLLKTEESGVNLDRFDGESTSAGEVLTAAQTLPFFGGHRLVLLRRADELSGPEQVRLSEGLSGIPPSNCLVMFWEGKADARSVLIQEVRRVGEALTLWAPFDNQMPRWVLQRSKALGLSLTQAAALRLVELCGVDPVDLLRELEKLATYADGKQLDVAQVEDLAEGGHRLPYLEWDRCFWRGDGPRALELLKAQREQGFPAVALLSTLSRMYLRWALGKASLAESPGASEEVLKKLWIRSRAAQEEFLAAARGTSWEKLDRALRRLLQLEWDLKTGRAHPETALTLLVTSLTSKN